MTVDIIQGSTVNLLIKGSWFTVTTTVNITGVTINSTVIVDSQTIRVNVTAPNSEGTFNLQVTNEGGTTTLIGAINIINQSWIDLRSQGDTLVTGTDVRLKTGLTLARDTDGMYFNGQGPWSSWIKFPIATWQRSEQKTLEMIFTRPSGFMMLGVGSLSTNENSTQQYSQGETLLYFDSSTNVYGFYGNNGNPGTAASQYDPTNVSGGTGIFKLKFENNGEPGSTFTLYELPSSNEVDWDNESNIRMTLTVDSGMTADSPTLVPFIIHNGNTQRFIALKVN